MTVSDISRIIVQRSQSFGLRSSAAFFIMENVSWGLFRWGECDLLICSKALYLTDIEVKTSISDLKADFLKKKWKPNHYKGKAFIRDIKYHYYAIPEELQTRATPILEEHRPNSGIIIVSRKLRCAESDYYTESCKTLKKAKANSKAKALAQNKLLNLARLSMFRYWRDDGKLQV